MVDLEPLRAELVGHCYRMLGSAFEAEDAVQETFVRAWRNADRYDSTRGAVRSWLYSIATNICLDMLRSAQRRARAVDLGPASEAGPDLGAPLPAGAWLEPIPDGKVLSVGGDPAALVAERESIRLAFVAALQSLPPRQRAVLILRDVLSWRAEEVAGLLHTTTASVTSALQRARATMGNTSSTSRTDVYDPLDPNQQRLLAQYCEAFERYDVEALVALLHEDATTSMPPFAWWLRGREQIRQAMLAAGRPCDGVRLVAAAANGSPAFAQYRPSPTGYAPFALTVLEIAEGRISDLTSYLDTARLFPLFDLPAELPADLARHR